MRKQKPISIRVDGDVYDAIDKIVAREKSNRGRVLREAVDLRIRVAAGAELTREAIERVAIEAIARIRVAGQESLKGIVEATRQSDERNRKLIVDFIEAMQTRATSGVRLPPRPSR